MGRGVYVHIPFCKSKCGYCDFNSVAGGEELWEPYLRAVCREIRENLPAGEEVDTVFFGGGTPTAPPGEYLAEILASVRETARVVPSAEITVEANPGTADGAKLRSLRAAGVNRISFGLQSTHAGHLETLGRAHTCADFLKSVEMARESGFDNLSADLMFGLPGQALSEWEETVKTVCRLGLSHISCYCLKIEEGTPFFARNVKPAPDDVSAAMYELGVEILRDAGYARYEISNFARAGFECRHNLKCWKTLDYQGFGVSAHSLVKGRRYSNPDDIGKYLKNPGRPAWEERLTAAAQMSEFVILGLRLEGGFREDEFLTRFGRGIDEIFGETAERMARRGLLSRRDGAIAINPRFFYVSNAIMCEFI